MDVNNKSYEWDIVECDPKSEIKLTDYEKQKEEEFWKCLREGKPFNFYPPKEQHNSDK